MRPIQTLRSCACHSHASQSRVTCCFKSLGRNSAASAGMSRDTMSPCLDVTRHTSHVTRHTSHDTRHMSHVTRHTPHVTRHTSHATRHTSHVTRHTSHVARHTSHVTRHTPHVTRHTPHVTRHMSHVTNHTPHATRHTSPVTRPNECPEVGHRGRGGGEKEGVQGGDADVSQPCAARRVTRDRCRRRVVREVQGRRM